jgi:alpha-beta hydrolase superfamily lysophospholipase
MNHVSKNFAMGDGKTCKSHSWERREGGYRRVALLLGNGLWPAAKEPRMIEFLLEHGFRVLSLDLSFGSATAPRPRLGAFRKAVSAFAEENIDPDLPFYLLASSFSAGAVLPIASAIPGLAGLALIAPVVDFPPPGIKKRCFLWPFSDLAIGPGDLCGEEALAASLVAEGLMPERASLRFSKRDLWTVASELAASIAEGLPVPMAVFTGEDDPFVSEAGRAALERSAAKVYAYPRVRHEPGRDRYADNFYADLSAFLGEAESTGVQRSE